MKLKKTKIILQKEKINIIKILIATCILFLMLFTLKGQIKHLNISKVFIVLRRESNFQIVLMLVLGIIAVSFISLYDIVLCKELNVDISYKKIFKISWISNTINNFIGSGGLAGGSIRTILYKKEGVDTLKAVNISLIIWLSTLTGLSGIIAINSKFILTLNNIFYLLICLILVLYIPFYIFLDKIPYFKNKFKSQAIMSISKKLKLKIIIVAVLEWYIAGLFFSFLIIKFTQNVTLYQCLAVFSLAITVGIVSFIPGGIGSFDLACIYGFQLFKIQDSGILVGILLYRIFYYVIPWLISMFILVLEFLSSKKSLNKSKLKNKNKRLDLVVNEIGIKALGALVFFCGIILIISSLTPAIIERIKIINKFLSMSMLQFSQIASMGIGLVLIILSKGILDRVKTSYHITLIFLLLGSMLTFIKGLDFEEAIFLIIIAGLLYLAKDRFYRESSPIKAKSCLESLMITFIASIVYIFIYQSIQHHRYHKLLLKEFIYTPNTILYYLLIIWIIAMTAQILKVNRIHFHQTNNQDLEKLKNFLIKHSGNSKTHLLFLKDKNFHFTINEKVLIAYKPFRDKMIVLGDPIGDKSLFKQAIMEFRKFADKYNMIPVFYEIDEENLPLYHENGYNFLKLGEEAEIDLNDFNLNGKKKADLRYVKNKIEKQIFNFEIIHPPFSGALLNKLETISNDWLEDRAEKGFSLGWFNREYINLTPIGVVKYKEEIIAFATIMPFYDDKNISIDLMRLISSPPNGTMDALFYGLINWAKDKGYDGFNLGMAPLSNVGVNEFSNIKERLGKYVYNYGNKIYSFKGLRKYKEKFDPIWSSKYLAYPIKSNLPSIILDLARLVSKAPNK